MATVTVMSEAYKFDLEQRIEEDRHKIEEMSAFRDDPKIDKIIRAFQKQIAQDSYHLSSFSSELPGDLPPRKKTKTEA